MKAPVISKVGIQPMEMEKFKTVEKVQLLVLLRPLFGSV